jgi:hypothetical protein
MGDLSIDRGWDEDEEQLSEAEIARRHELLFCPACQHEHKGEHLGFICVGCPCPKAPPFRKLSL